MPKKSTPEEIQRQMAEVRRKIKFLWHCSCGGKVIDMQAINGPIACDTCRKVFKEGMRNPSMNDPWKKLPDDREPIKE